MGNITTPNLYKEIAELANEYVDTQMDAFYEESFAEELRNRYPNLNIGEQQPSTPGTSPSP